MTAASFVVEEFEYFVYGVTVPVHVKLRRGTSEEWEKANPLIRFGELCYDSTNRKLKKGDGITPRSDLPWFAELC